MEERDQRFRALGHWASSSLDSTLKLLALRVEGYRLYCAEGFGFGIQDWRWLSGGGPRAITIITVKALH